MAIDLKPLEDVSLLASLISDVTLVLSGRNIGIREQRSIQASQDEVSLGTGFLFHYEGENSIILNSKVTDHFTEENNPINDHVALSPEQITVEGFVGEIPSNSSFGDLDNLLGTGATQFAAGADDVDNLLVTRLSLIGALTPKIRDSARRTINTITRSAQVASNTARASFDAYRAIIGQQQLQNAQQTAFQHFFNLWKRKTFFTVQTPWQIFNNMIILSLESMQDEETRTISSFKITFKKMNFATTEVETLNVDGRRKNQASALVNLGKVNLV